MFRLAASVAALAVLLPAQSGAAFDRAKLEAFIRHLLLWGQHVTVNIGDPRPSEVPGFREVTVAASAGNASLEETFLVSTDGTKVIRGTVYDTTRNPFQADADRINLKQQPSFGAADAPVKIVVYSDFQCSFCKEEARQLRRDLPADAPGVQVFFKDFPLDAIHPWARPAAMAGRCAFRQKPDAFWLFHDWVFDKQGELNSENLKEKVVSWAAEAKLDVASLANCIDSRATAAEVEQSFQEGKALGVNSTPTMFVNGRKLVGQIPWANLKQIIENERTFQQRMAEARCCAVTLPVPAKK